LVEIKKRLLISYEKYEQALYLESEQYVLDQSSRPISDYQGNEFYKYKFRSNNNWSQQY